MVLEGKSGFQSLGKEDIEKKIKEMEKFIDEHLSKRISSKEIKPETFSTYPKIEELIKQRPVVEDQKIEDEGTPPKPLAIESILEKEGKEEERIKKEQIENELNEEDVIEHVLFDEEDPFFLEETGMETASREYIKDVELPKESLRFKPHVEFRPPERWGKSIFPLREKSLRR